MILNVQSIRPAITACALRRPFGTASSSSPAPTSPSPATSVPTWPGCWRRSRSATAGSGSTSAWRSRRGSGRSRWARRRSTRSSRTSSTNARQLRPGQRRHDPRGAGRRAGLAPGGGRRPRGVAGQRGARLRSPLHHRPRPGRHRPGPRHRARADRGPRGHDRARAVGARGGVPDRAAGPVACAGAHCARRRTSGGWSRSGSRRLLPRRGGKPTVTRGARGSGRPCQPILLMNRA